VCANKLFHSTRDVAKLLRREIRRSGTSLKAAVNHFLRLGLMVSGKPDRKAVRGSSKGIGFCPPGLSYDNVEDLIEAIERYNAQVIVLDANILLYAYDTSFGASC